MFSTNIFTVTLAELVCELNDEIKDLPCGLSPKECLSEIKSKVPGASRMTNLQLLLLATTVSNKSEFIEKVFIEFLDSSSEMPQRGEFDLSSSSLAD